MTHHFVKIVFFALIVGCAPLYNNNHSNSNITWNIQSDDYLEQFKLENYLKIHSLVINNKKKITAKIKLNMTFDPLAYAMNITYIRYMGSVNASLEIYDEDKMILQKTIKIVSSYNSNQEFEAVCSKDAAKERLLQSLALAIVKEISIIS